MEKRKATNSVLALTGKERYHHFIKVVCDWEEVWGLYNDGWALAALEDGQQVFPLWPKKEYAQLCLAKEWVDYKPEVFSLTECMEELLPSLRADNILPGIFYTPSDTGVTTTIEQLLNDLNEELEQY